MARSRLGRGGRVCGQSATRRSYGGKNETDPCLEPVSRGGRGDAQKRARRRKLWNPCSGSSHPLPDSFTASEPPHSASLRARSAPRVSGFGGRGVGRRRTPCQMVSRSSTRTDTSGTDDPRRAIRDRRHRPVRIGGSAGRRSLLRVQIETAWVKVAGQV
jgi:hypothetical protein